MTFIENVQFIIWILIFLDDLHGLKIDIKVDETSENMSFSAFLTTSNTWIVKSTTENQKYIDICRYSPGKNLHHISISF